MTRVAPFARQHAVLESGAGRPGNSRPSGGIERRRAGRDGGALGERGAFANAGAAVRAIGRAATVFAGVALGASWFGVAPAAEAKMAVADIVDRDGRAHWPAGFAGAVDVGHYDLYVAANGEPRFLPRATAAQVAADAPLDEAGWSGFGGFRHGCNGPINAIVRMPGGDLVFGGGFHACGSVYAEGVVRWDGSRWSALPQPPDVPGYGVIIGAGAIHAMAVRNGELIIAGANTAIGTVEGSQYDVARWDGTAWHALVPGVKINEDNSQTFRGVRSIAMIGTDVYFGGDIYDATFDDGSPHAYLHNLARWDGSAWHGVAGSNPACDPNVPGVDGVVNALATDGVGLYVGGDFAAACTQQGDDRPGVAAFHVARWNAGTWSGLGGAEANGVDGVVQALAYDSGSLYVGGAFGTAGSILAPGIARWNGTIWSPVGTAAQNGIAGTVDSIAAFGGRLYVGGAFRFAGTVAALRVAQWDGSRWSALGDGLGTASDGDSTSVAAILADAGGVFAAGTIVQIAGGDTIGGMARWNGASWLPLVDRSDLTKIDGQVNAFAVRGTDLYVGGSFARVGEVPANNVARWDGRSWSSMGTGFANGADGAVLALSATDGNVYVGGAFTHAGGLVANHVARWDGVAWHPLGSGAGNGTDGAVRALASAADTAVYAGGDFTSAGGQTANYVAGWNGSAWQALSAGVCGNVYALAAYGGGVYVGGNFPSPIVTCSGTNPGNNVAYWTGSEWNALLDRNASLPVNGVTASGFGTSAVVFSLLMSDADLYVGGSFNQVQTAAGALLVRNVARWRNGSWDSLFAQNTALQPVYSMAMLEGKLRAGALDGSIWRYDESVNLPNWRTFGNAYPFGRVEAFAVVGSTMYAGGQFLQVTSPTRGVISEGWAGYQVPVIFANGFD